jgi:hypothetical protein
MNYGNDTPGDAGSLARVPSVTVMSLVTSVLRSETGGNLAEILRISGWFA